MSVDTIKCEEAFDFVCDLPWLESPVRSYVGMWIYFYVYGLCV